MNLLSIGAAYGVLVAVFQWGWGKNRIGVGKTGPIESFLPMMLFAILFGLSMDYEVFLLSRIKEEYDRNGHDNREAVANGLAAHRPGHHRGGGDHGLRLRQLRVRRPAGHQGVRPRPRRRGAHRRHARADGARSRHDGAARRRQLVVPALAATGCRRSTSTAPSAW